MSVTLQPDVEVVHSQSKTVNIFDLTATDKETSRSSTELSTKEKAVRIALILILSMVVLTALFLLLAEAFGLKWAVCTKPHPLYLRTWMHWPRIFQRDYDPYQEYWNSLSLAEKREEMFRATYGEVDLFDMYEEMSKNHHKPVTPEDVVH